MAYKPVAGPQIAAPNVIPMADIMLVLLIIFMVVTPLLTKDVPVDMAAAANPREMLDADKDDAIVVAITRDGRIFIGNTQMQKEDLTGQVKDRISSRLDKTVYVKSDARAKYSEIGKEPADCSSARGLRTVVPVVPVGPGPGGVCRQVVDCTSRLLIFSRRAGSHPARYYGLRSGSASGLQENRYGDRCRRGKRRSALVTQCGAAD